MNIKKIEAREILDSRGIPTIACTLLLDDGNRVVSSVPSGASVGKFEALELRDNDTKRYFGKGVLQAVEHIEKIIAPVLLQKYPDLVVMDKLLCDLDGTENKSRLGANAILAVSMAIARAQAIVENVEVYKLLGNIAGISPFQKPCCMFNILNGGVHADNMIAFQEFMIMPSSIYSFERQLEMSVIIYRQLKKLLKEKSFSVGVGDEGGFAPFLGNERDPGHEKVLNLLLQAVEKSGFVPGKDIMFCLDVAASEFYNESEKKYILADKRVNSDELISLYEKLIVDYPIYSIEDGLSQDDWDGWSVLTAKLGSKIQLVGDDIFVTNTNRIQKGIEYGVANAVLIKLNQIGTVTETLQAIKLCKDNGYKTIVSHRSGETIDSFIADLAVGTNAGQLKAGACARGERVVKYNRLLEIMC
jgi:enolase